MTPAFAYADVRGARLAYNVTGKGDPVVWAHGMTSAAYTQERAGHFDWRPVSASHRLIRYDARGHGRSTGGTDPVEYTWSELGKDLLGLLDVVVLKGKVGAIGSSMGTASILYAALDRPTRFSRLVLTTPPTCWETRPAANGMRLGSAQLVEDKGVAALVALSVDEPASPALVDSRRNINPVKVSAKRLPAVFRGSAQTDFPPRERVAELELPVLVLCWTGDGTHPVSSGEALAQTLPNAELVVANTPAELATWGDRAAAFLR
ncbi:alpha/beta fold hydrolase [Gordonia araii]|nr:alpha/beta hydrolase [Gordonia araii]NNG96058.1 alpha/beta hydrolase [Gordonia araii NBRC 100433]